MKFNRALLIPALLAFPLASCGSSPKRCEPVPGLSHSYPPATGPTYVGGGLQAAAPGPDWMWLEGCWYWNGNDWAWLETQWMPPGGQMNYVGPQDSRNDYCVYQPTQSYTLPVAMPWPPDAGPGIGYAVQEVVVGGEYGSRRPGNWQTGAVRDHRGKTPPRRNEVVPARPGRVSTPDYDFDDIYLGPGPAARPPAVSPPTPPRNPRPEAPSAGPVAPPAPPVVTRPPRPSAPPQGPAAQPPRRVRHDPPVSAPPPPPAPPSRPQAPISRPAAPAPAPARPAPARPAPPPRAAPRPTPPAAAPARPAAPPSRGTAPSRGRRN